MAVRDWLKSEGRQKEWAAWKRRLMSVIPSYQKFEWNVKDRPSTTSTQMIPRD